MKFNLNNNQKKQVVKSLCLQLIVINVLELLIYYCYLY